MSDPNYLVRILKGREASPPPEPEPPEPEPAVVEMPPEEDPLEVKPTVTPAPLVDGAERARQQAEAERIEKERLAVREAKRKAREERAAAREERAAARAAKRRKNAEVRARRLAKLEAALPEPIAFMSVSSTVQSRINILAVAAKSGREADARKLVDSYEAAGFRLMDLQAAMSDHFEDDARTWASDETIAAWVTCRRADWLAWVCSGGVGWGYPGLWSAATDCVRQAIAVASRQIPGEVAGFLRDAVRDLDIFIGSWRREQPDLELLDDLRRSTKKLVENVAKRLKTKPSLATALKAAEAVRALVCLDPDDCPPADAIVRAAAVLAAAIPERSALPASWLPDDPDRAAKWASEGRPRAEIEAKLAFLAPLVRKRVPVPVSPHSP